MNRRAFSRLPARPPHCFPLSACAQSQSPPDEAEGLTRTIVVSGRPATVVRSHQDEPPTPVEFIGASSPTPQLRASRPRDKNRISGTD
jgi:hypothetical protein